MALFILPGFITTRLADVVGVMHLMALTLIVTQRTAEANANTMETFGNGNTGNAGLSRCRWCGQPLVSVVNDASSTTSTSDCYRWKYPSPHEDVVVYRSRDDVPNRPPLEGSTLERIKTEKGAARRLSPRPLALLVLQSAAAPGRPGRGIDAPLGRTTAGAAGVRSLLPRHGGRAIGIRGN